MKLFQFSQSIVIIILILIIIYTVSNQMDNKCLKCKNCINFKKDEDHFGKCENCKHNVVYHSSNFSSKDPLNIFLKISKIEKNIFMGSYKSATNEIELKTHKISHIVNVVSKTTAKYPYQTYEDIKYCYVDIPDSKSATISNQIRKVLNFVKSAIEENGNILIHCMRGISRSGAIIISCLIEIYDYSFEESIILIKEKRNIFNPNKNLLDQVKMYNNF